MNLKEILATLQTDETGWRVRGRNWWLWVIGTQDTAYFTVDKTRQTLSSLGRRHAALSSCYNGSNDVRQCWNQVEDCRRTLDFFCGGSATTPATPPTGTYQVNVTPKTFTFNGVTSRSIDADLNNGYVPAVKLIMDGNGKITRIYWQWWKKSIHSWVQPTDSELAHELKNAEFSIGQAAGQVILPPAG